jgi:hypothetical protein
MEGKEMRAGELLRTLSQIARGEVSQNGETQKPSVRERLQAIELLGKRLRVFGENAADKTEKVVILDDIPKS